MAISRNRSRASSEGNPQKFIDMASELFGSRSSQGKGKTVADRSSYASAGNPKQFLDMASELRRPTQY
ncbi:MAG: hypothetical protein NW237_15880 [Cyanobacteriota bacterium]|nr:hypothetical protein [Cyanobacteriota bacterium]